MSRFLDVYSRQILEKDGMEHTNQYNYASNFETFFYIALMTNGVRVSVARGAGGGGSGTARSRAILAKQVILPKGPN